MQRSYHILGRSDQPKLPQTGCLPALATGSFCCHWVELIATIAVSRRRQLIDVVGRPAIEAVLELPAAQVAGPNAVRAGGAVG